ncbi:SMI1/KNR4 family protein (plasmid) [Streptomyces sp. Qhu-G9]|uniref:SMI1/KNR4 family protein n=1 Tax=Streptomyces sp. Qhu-G9 TaxID=3452799 RepID=UPI0022AC576B|nr:SMI1/KNR4 family protein [Streptomyces aurantiacus]WAU78462.1 SMI1/KNR4 family protein [Streptomyces aurantiacus]
MMHPAVERLARLYPQAAAQDDRPAVDWESAEAELGSPLPDDYKELVERFGGGVLDDTFWLLEPGCEDPDYDLVAMTAEREEVLAELWKTEPKPEPLASQDARLIPWAYAEESGHYLYWLGLPQQEPSDWTIMINEGRGSDWEHQALPCAEFLARILTGELSSPMFPELPTSPHTFRPNSEII